MMDAGELALTPRPLGQLIDGQVIEPRKAQIAAYSRAVGVIPDKIDSYLYRQEEARHVSETEEEAARQSIKKFMETDQLPKSVIIKKSAPSHSERVVDAAPACQGDSATHQEIYSIEIRNRL